MSNEETPPSSAEGERTGFTVQRPNPIRISLHIGRLTNASGRIYHTTISEAPSKPRSAAIAISGFKYQVGKKVRSFSEQ